MITKERNFKMSMNFAQNFISLRRIYGLTQETVSEELGVSRQAFAKWEGGNSVPDIYILLDIASLFDVSLDDLIRERFDTPGKLKEISKRHNESGFENTTINPDKIKQDLKDINNETEEFGDFLYKEYLKNIKREDLTVDEIGYYQFYLKKELETGNYIEALKLCNKCMSLGHGTAYNVFDMVNIFACMLKDNYYNHDLYPYEIGKGLEDEREEYICEMRNLAEHMEAYSQIILAEMEHMEDDRYWSLEEAEMLEMGEELENPIDETKTIIVTEDMELPFV